MAESITIKALQDASLDAKSLEEVVNGNDAKQVTTRLGESYPSVKKSIKTLFENGGLPAVPFATKSLMTASALANDKYAMVTEDTVNNGLYVKTAGTWVKSDYDPLTNSKSYTDDKTSILQSNFKVVQQGEGIFFTTADDIPLFYVLNNGDFYLCGDKKELRSQLKNISEISASPNLIDFLDVNENLVAYLDANAEFFIVGQKTSIQTQLQESTAINLLTLKINTITDVQGKALISDLALNTFKNTKVNELTIVEPYVSNREIHRIGAMLELPDKKILFMWGKGVGSPYNGDGEGVELYKRIITYSDDGNILDLGSKVLVRSTSEPAGLAKHPMIGRTKTGRIVLIWDERNSDMATGGSNYITMIAFSDNEGVTFTAPTIIPINPATEIQVTGSTGTIVTLSTGRLVCPMYHISPNGLSLMYSDDNGATWSYSETHISAGKSLQEPSITADTNDVIYISARHTNGSQSFKYLAKSTDMGLTIIDGDYNYDLVSPYVASSIYYDKELGIMLHSSPTGRFRDNYAIQLSADKGLSWKIGTKPFDSNFYIGYTQLIKLSNGNYAVCVEGLTNGASVNTSENIGIFIFNLKEVFANVYSN